MADIVQADYEILGTVAKRFAQQSNKIRQMHSRLNRQVALLRPTWVGRGSEAFFAEMTEKVLPGVQRLGAALAEADRVTRQIEEILHGAEEQGSSPFRRDEESVFRALPYGIGAGGGESGGADDGLADGAGGELGGSSVGADASEIPVGGAGGEPEGGSGSGSDQEFSIDNLGSGSGGAWDDDSFRPFDINDPLLDQLYEDHGFSTTGDFGGGEPGSLGPGGDSSFAVPDDWLAGVERALSSPRNDDLGQDLGGADGSGSGGGDMGGASGEGGGSNNDMGGGSGSGSGGASGGDSSGSNMGGGTGSGGAPTGSASPVGGTGQAPAAIMPVGQGNSMDAPNQSAAAVLPAALRFPAIGGSGADIQAVTGAGASGSAVSVGAVAAAPQAAQANVGVPMGLAALAPLLALLGKGIKDRATNS